MHPEVYVCAPLRHLLAYICLICMLSCSNQSIKTFSQYDIGNDVVLSEKKSHLSGAESHKKGWRVKPTTSKIMNLNYSLLEPHYSLCYSQIKAQVHHGYSPVRTNNLGTTGEQTTNKVGWGQGSKVGNWWLLDGTLGLPKGRKSYGNGVVVVDNNRAIHTIVEGRQGNNGGKKSKKVSGLEILKDLKKCPPGSNQTFKNLINIIADIQVLTLAYELIKSKLGNMTPGVDKTTLDAMSLKKLENLSKKLLEGTFKFGLARRIHIPKPGKKGLRPLTIASPVDKVVQNAIKLVLEAIYEPQFYDFSHGFRPGKGCHTALKMLDQQFKGAVWVIEGDITKCFDTINHDKLLDIIGKKVKCEATLNLLKLALTAGFVEFGQMAVIGDLGTPQGSVLSPLLCNIYMHELDHFMEQLMQEKNRGKTRAKNLAYSQLQYQKENINLTTEEKRQIGIQMRKIPSKELFDPNFTRVKYIRYADDFVISVIGPKKLAEEIKSEVSSYLKNELMLDMSVDKTKLTHFSSQPIFFLGTEIMRRNVEKPVKQVIVKGEILKTRITPRLSLHAPIPKLIKKLVEGKFYKWNKDCTKAVPTACGRLVNMDHADIVSFYNSKIMGILNYYSFTDNHKSLGSIAHGLKHSCALTLSLKYKMRQRAKVFKKFGIYLTCPETGVKLKIPNTFGRTRTFMIKAIDPFVTIEKVWNDKLTKTGITKVCIICGVAPVHMHHVRQIKDLKKRSHLDWFTMQMAAINRKQVPLCEIHHIKLHRNQLSENERDSFKIGCKEYVNKGNKLSTPMIMPKRREFAYRILTN